MALLSLNVSNSSNFTTQNQNLNLMLSLIDKIDKFEYFLIPSCFLIGLIGNLLGSVCLLSNKKMRKRTPLFILSSIGFADTLLLISQLQRWLAIYYGKDNFLITNSLCKFYFMFFRCSILISASLTFVLIITRFISFYMGSYRLSTYSNLGQACSRLCVAYIIALALSLSWHELWTSGLKDGDLPITERDEPDYYFYRKTTTKKINHKLEDLSCSKNVTSIELVKYLNIFYFLIVLILYSLLLLTPVIVYIKLKGFDKYIVCLRSEYDFSTRCSLEEDVKYSSGNGRRDNSVSSTSKSSSYGNQNHERRKSKKSYSLPNFKMSNSHSDYALKRSSERKTISEQDLNNSGRTGKSASGKTGKIYRQRSHLNLKKKLKKRPKNFTTFVCFISFISAVFCLPFVIFDFLYYRVVDLKFASNTSNYKSLINSTDLDQVTNQFTKTCQRLPLILINVPHAFKFYFLFVFYSKFRHQLSRFLKIRFYFNKSLIKKELARSNRQSSLEIVDISSSGQIGPRESVALRSIDENNFDFKSFSNSASPQTEVGLRVNRNKRLLNARFVVMHHFNLACCCFRKSEIASSLILNSSNEFRKKICMPSSGSFNNCVRKKIFVKKFLLNFESNRNGEDGRDGGDVDSDTSSIVGFNAYSNFNQSSACGNYANVNSLASNAYNLESFDLELNNNAAFSIQLIEVNEISNIARVTRLDEDEGLDVDKKNCDF